MEKELNWNLFSKSCQQHGAQAHANKLFMLYKEGLDSRLQTIPEYNYSSKILYMENCCEITGASVDNLLEEIRTKLMSSIPKEDLADYPDGVSVWWEGCEVTLLKKIPVPEKTLLAIEEDNNFWYKMKGKLDRVLITYEGLVLQENADHKASLQRQIEELQAEMENL